MINTISMIGTVVWAVSLGLLLLSALIGEVDFTTDEENKVIKIAFEG